MPWCQEVHLTSILNKRGKLLHSRPRTKPLGPSILFLQRIGRAWDRFHSSLLFHLASPFCVDSSCSGHCRSDIVERTCLVTTTSSKQYQSENVAQLKSLYLSLRPPNNALAYRLGSTISRPEPTSDFPGFWQAEGTFSYTPSSPSLLYSVFAMSGPRWTTILWWVTHLRNEHDKSIPQLLLTGAIRNVR